MVKPHHRYKNGRYSLEVLQERRYMKRLLRESKETVERAEAAYLLRWQESSVKVAPVHERPTEA